MTRLNHVITRFWSNYKICAKLNLQNFQNLFWHSTDIIWTSRLSAQNMRGVVILLRKLFWGSNGVQIWVYIYNGPIGDFWLNSILNYISKTHFATGSVGICVPCELKKGRISNGSPRSQNLNRIGNLVKYSCISPFLFIWFRLHA